MRSLCHQDDQDFELIVVDNGSSDRTVEVARSFGARVLYEKTPGVGYARQRGFLRSRGEIIASTDADTIVPINWVSDIRKRFSKEERLSAFGGSYNLYSGALFTRLTVRYFFRPIWLLDRISMGNWSLAGSNMAVRRDIFLKIGGFRPDLQLGEDANLSHRLASFGKVGFDFQFSVKTSGRRYRHGLLLGLMTYAPNGFVRMVFKKERFVRLPTIRTETSFLQNLALLPIIISLLVLSYLFYSFNQTVLAAKEQEVKEFNFFLKKVVSDKASAHSTGAIIKKKRGAHEK